MNLLLAVGVLLQLVQIYRTPVAIGNIPATTTTTITTGQKAEDNIKISSQQVPVLPPRDLRVSSLGTTPPLVAQSVQQQENNIAPGWRKDDYYNDESLMSREEEPTTYPVVHAAAKRRYDLNGWILDHEQQQEFHQSNNFMEDSRSRPEEEEAEAAQAASADEEVLPEECSEDPEAGRPQGLPVHHVLPQHNPREECSEAA